MLYHLIKIILILYIVAVLLLNTVMFGRKGFDRKKKRDRRRLIACCLFPLLYFPPFERWADK